MVILLTAILTSTLTQSTVTYPTRLVPISAKPAVPRSVQFYTNTANTFYYRMRRWDLDFSSVVSSMY